jgi:hypothetical protein
LRLCRGRGWPLKRRPNIKQPRAVLPTSSAATSRLFWPPNGDCVYGSARATAKRSSAKRKGKARLFAHGWAAFKQPKKCNRASSLGFSLIHTWFFVLFLCKMDHLHQNLFTQTFMIGLGDVTFLHIAHEKSNENTGKLTFNYRRFKSPFFSAFCG